MSFRSLKRLRKTLSFRLTVWYSVLFILSYLVLFGLAYVQLAVALRQRDRESIHLKLQELAAYYQAEGLNGLQNGLALQERLQQTRPFFIRFATASNATLLVKIPGEGVDFDWKQLEQRAIIGNEQWIQIPAHNDDDILEICTLHMPDGSLLQVGRSNDDRDDVLEAFAGIVAGIMILVAAGSMFGGTFLALRALRPIRHLLQTVQAIDAGAMDVRVPTYQTGDELDELSRLFNTMLGKIAALISGMRSALDNVAHDLRTPMTRFRGIAELALGTEADLAVYREALADCVEESDRVLMMLNTLLDISEAETGTMRLELAEVNISVLLEDAVDLYGEVAAAKDLNVSVAATEGLCLRADRNRMQQVLANLLDNAIKYTPSGGKIALRAYQQRQQAVILVEDTGMGMSPDELPKIWDRLYRGDDSRSQRGLGLGLSLVKAVVQAHQGAVEVSSIPGVGSQFTLCFPLALPASGSLPSATAL
jgi:signal transduction histidine kinase